MNLEAYLKSEFNTYPKMFRDTVNFLTKPSVLKRITAPGDAGVCESCGQKPNVKKTRSRKGDRFSVVCSCGESTGTFNYEFQAVWGWRGKKCSETKENPLIDSLSFSNKLKSAKSSSKNDELWFWLD